MKHIKTYENYLTKKDQPDEYLYNFGFGDRYYICSECGSHKLTPKRKGGFTPPDWYCNDCNNMNYAPKWMDPEEYWIEKNIDKYNI